MSLRIAIKYQHLEKWRFFLNTLYIEPRDEHLSSLWYNSVMPTTLLGIEAKRYLASQSDATDGVIGGVNVAGDLHACYPMRTMLVALGKGTFHE